MQPDEYSPAVPLATWLTITSLEGRVGLRLTGQADTFTVPALRRAAVGLPGDAHEIHLQLAGLEFIDVAGARFVVSLTERPGRPHLILNYPPRCLIRIIRLCWPDALARVTVHGDRERPRPHGSHAEPATLTPLSPPASA